MIKVRNLNFAYTKEYNILYNISFEIKNNETIFIYGEQESGRSTLLRILTGIEEPTSGEVIYDNLPVSKEIFKNDVALGFVPEKLAYIENKSVYKNLEYILNIRKVNKVLRDVKINNALKCYNLEPLKNEKIKNLGRFDRLKVALARLSLRKLDYIIIDDVFKDLPLSDIDYFITELKNLIKSNNAAAIIVSDNPDIAKKLDCKNYKLENGVLTCSEGKNV